MFPILHIGPLAIQTPGLLLLASIWIGLNIAEKRAHFHGMSSETLDTIVTPALIAFVTGGRAAYILLHLSIFRDSPSDIVSLDPALFDPFGGMATAFIVGWIYAYGQNEKVEFGPMLDALTPFFATLAVGLGAAHLASGAAFGAETSLPWGIQLHGATRHPSQMYEVASALFIMNLVALRRPYLVPGRQFLTWVAWTAGAALFLGAFRGDSILVFSGVRLSQVYAWITLALTLLGMEWLQRGWQDANPPQVYR